MKTKQTPKYIQLRFRGTNKAFYDAIVAHIIPGFSSKKDLLRVCYSFPNYRQKIRKYGIIALELKQKRRL